MRDRVEQTEAVNLRRFHLFPLVFQQQKMVVWWVHVGDMAQKEKCERRLTILWQNTVALLRLYIYKFKIVTGDSVNIT